MSLLLFFKTPVVITPIAASDGAAISVAETTEVALPGVSTGPKYLGVVGTANNGATSSATIILTVAMAVPAGATVFLTPNANGDGSISTITDTRGNTYNVDRVSTSTTGGQFASSLLTTALQVGDTITFTGTTSLGSRTLVASAFSGIMASPVDQNQSSSGSGTQAVSVALPAATSQASEVAIGILGTSNASSADTFGTPDAGWTEVARAIGSARQQMQVYRILTATGNYTVGGSFTVSSTWRAALVTYKADPVSAGPPTVLKNASDTSAISVSDASSPPVTGGGGPTTISGTESPAVSVAETNSILVTVTTTDTSAITISGVVTPAVSVTTTDTSAVSVSDAATLSADILISASDGAGISVSETSTAVNGTVTTPAFVKLVGVAVNSTSQATIVIPVGAGGAAVGNTVIVTLNGNGNGSVNSVTDSRGNAWSIDFNSVATTGGQYVSSKLTTALQQGDTITVTGVGSIASRVAVAGEYSGVAPAPAREAYGTDSTTSTSYSSGTIPATTYYPDLVVGSVGTSSITGDVYSSMDATYAEVSRAIGASRQIMQAYKVISTSGTPTFSGTLSSSVGWRATAVPYRGEFVPAGTVTPISANDTGSISVSEVATIAVTVTTTDTSAISVSDVSSQTAAVLKSTTDTSAISVADVASPIANTVNTSDTSAISVADVSTSSSTLTATESNSLTIADDSTLTPTGGLTIKRNNFDSGTEGVAVTPANSAAAGGYAIDSAAGSGTATYKASAAIRGAMGVNIAATTAVSKYFSMRFAAQVSAASAQIYFRVNSTPATANTAFFRFLDVNALALARILYETNNTLTLVSANNATLHTSPTLTTGTIYRLQLQSAIGTTSTGTIGYQLYDDDDNLIDSYSSSTVNAGTTNINFLQFGKVSATATNFDFDFDEPAFIESTLEIPGVDKPIAIKSATDTSALSVSDVSTRAIQTAISATDTAAISVADVASNVKSVTTTDTGAISVADTSTVLTTITATESISVSVDDVSTPSVTINATDTSAVSVSDSSTKVDGTYATPAHVKVVGTAINAGTSATIVIPVGAGGAAVGNTVIITLNGNGNGTVNSVTDSRGNTWNLDSNLAATTGGQYVSSKLTTALQQGDSITVTGPTAIPSRVAIAAEYSGLAASPALDQIVTNAQTNTTPSSGTSASTTHAPELVIGYLGTSAGATDIFSTIDATYTEVSRVIGSARQMLQAYKVVASTGTQSFSGTLTTSFGWRATAAAFTAEFVPSGTITPISTTDTASISVADASTSNITVSTTDTSAVSVTDVATTGASVLKSGAESPAVSISDSSSVSVTFSTTDTGAVTIADTSSIASTLSRTDTAAITISEAASSGAGNFLSTTDNGAISIAEVSSIAVTQSTTDTAAVTINESTILSSTLTRTDTAAVSVAEVSNASLSLPGNESTALSISETAFVAVSSSATDTAAITISATTTGAGGGTNTLEFGDDFNYGPGALSANWVSTASPMTVSGNAVVTPAAVTESRWVSAATGAVQVSEAVYKGGTGVGVAVAMPAFASGTTYANAGQWYIFRSSTTAGNGCGIRLKDLGLTSHTNLASSVTNLVAGDVMKLEYDGTTLTAYINGVVVMTHSPTTPITGQNYVGIHYGSTTASITALDDWAGGSAPSGTTAVPTTDSASIAVAESSSVFISSGPSTTDTSAISVAETRTTLVTLSATDTGAISVSDTSTPPAATAKSATDTGAISVAEASTVVPTTFSGYTTPQYVGLVGKTVNASASSSITITSTRAVAAGNRIIVALNGNGNGTVNSVSDTKGNSWSIDLNSAATTGGQFVSALITSPLAIGDTITVVGAASISSRVAVAMEVSGLAEPAVDVTATTSTTSTTPSITSATQTKQTVEFVVGSIGTSAPTSGDVYATLDSSYTEAGRAIGASRQILAAYKNVSTVGTQSISGTLTTSTGWRASVVSYAAAGALPAGVVAKVASESIGLKVTETTSGLPVVAPPAMPIGDLQPDANSSTGWKQVLAEEFNTNAAEGQFLANYPGWSAYPDTWDNNHTSFYNGGAGVGVNGGIMRVHCYTDSNGMHRTDTLRPPVGKGNIQQYGIYEICYRLPEEIPGYKQAWLLWPETNDGQDGEIDFPETSFDAGSTIRGYVHTVQNQAVNASSVNTQQVLPGTGWHVARIVWSPSKVEFWLDGALKNSYTSAVNVPSMRMTWRIQTEGNLSGTTHLIPRRDGTIPPDATGIDPATDGYVEIAYATVWEVATTTPPVAKSATDGGAIGIAESTTLTKTFPTATQTLTWLWTGTPLPTSMPISAKVSGGTNFRTVVSTTADLLTNPIYSGYVGKDANNYIKITTTGLQPGTQYYYGVEIDGGVATKRGSFKTAPTTPVSFKMAFSSCNNSNTTSTAYKRMLDRSPDFVAHLGDFHYENISTNDASLYRAAYDMQFGKSDSQNALFAAVPVVYQWSDHDFGPNNATSTAVGAPAAQSTYRQIVPSGPLVESTGAVYYTFVYGRVRFIMTDGRSNKSPISTTNIESSTKTLLGATQKQWLKDTITAATEPLILWMADVPWTDAVGPDDEYAAYNYERQELGTFIANSGKKVVYVHGDTHALGANDGSSGSPGNIPTIAAAPFNQTASQKGTYTSGPYPASGSSVVQQYGVVDITDTGGSTITLTFTGYDTSDVARTSLVVTAAATASVVVGGSDGGAISVSETNSRFVSKSASDTGAISVADSGSFGGGTALIAASDTAAISLAETRTRTGAGYVFNEDSGSTDDDYASGEGARATDESGTTDTIAAVKYVSSGDHLVALGDNSGSTDQSDYASGRSVRTTESSGSADNVTTVKFAQAPYARTFNENSGSTDNQFRSGSKASGTDIAGSTDYMAYVKNTVTFETTSRNENAGSTDFGQTTDDVWAELRGENSGATDAVTPRKYTQANTTRTISDNSGVTDSDWHSGQSVRRTDVSGSTDSTSYTKVTVTFESASRNENAGSTDAGQSTDDVWAELRSENSGVTDSVASRKYTQANTVRTLTDNSGATDTGWNTGQSTRRTDVSGSTDQMSYIKVAVTLETTSRSENSGSTDAGQTADSIWSETRNDNSGASDAVLVNQQRSITASDTAAITITSTVGTSPTAPGLETIGLGIAEQATVAIQITRTDTGAVSVSEVSSIPVVTKAVTATDGAAITITESRQVIRTFPGTELVSISVSETASVNVLNRTGTVIWGRANGVWKLASAYVYHNGVWQRAVFRVYRNGNWT